MKSKKLLASESKNEFYVDEPEEVGEYSEDEWTPAAVVCFISNIILCYE